MPQIDDGFPITPLLECDAGKFYKKTFVFRAQAMSGLKGLAGFVPSLEARQRSSVVEVEFGGRSRNASYGIHHFLPASLSQQLSDLLRLGNSGRETLAKERNLTADE